MSRWFLSVAAAVAALVILVGPTSASRVWCARDPIVALNGNPVQIWAAIPVEYQGAVSGPVKVTIRVPEDVSRDVLFMDAGFNGYGEDVEFVTARNLSVRDDGSFDALVKVSVPVDVAALAAAGVVDGAIPLRITIVTHGDLVETEPGQLTIAGGHERVVEGLSYGVRVTVQVGRAP